MKIICDVGHPAHVHLFKNVLQILKDSGHQYLVTAREKDVTVRLLEVYRMPHVCFGKHYASMHSKLYGVFKYTCMLLKTASAFQPDVFISHGSVSAAVAAAVMRKPHISMEDTGNMEQIRLYKPFTDAILTSYCFTKNLGEKQIRYNGYHELAYLSPDYFTPDPSVFDYLNLQRHDKYIIMRFVAWKSTHDFSHMGITHSNKILAARKFSEYAKVFISSEKALPNELNKYTIRIPPERMHDALFYATLLFGESATMASECAALGTPSIFVDDTGRYYTDEEEKKYGLVFNFSESLADQKASIDKGIELLMQDNLKETYNDKRKKMLAEKVDVAKFVAWFIENYPASFKQMKQTPDYQRRFRMEANSRS